jgi:hypothetical protein
MKPVGSSIFLFLSLLAVCQSTGAASQGIALAALSKQLATEKSKPDGSASEARCPDALVEFEGLSRTEIHRSLGSPDTFMLKTISPPKISEATYFIAPKALPGARGGGHPEVTFYFNESEQVLRAACKLSR